MTRRSSGTLDAQWQVERLHRADAAKSVKRAKGDTSLDDVRRVEELGPVDPPGPEVLADSIWTAAGTLMGAYEKDDPKPAVTPLLEVAEALGCVRADIELGRRRLIEARALREAEEASAGEETAGLKRCSTCKEHKPRDEFYRDKREIDGLDYRCKGCFQIQNAASAKRRRQRRARVA